METRILVNAFKILLLIMMLSTLLLGCSSVKKVERFQRNNPEIFSSIKDTVIIKDTIYKTLPGSQADSVFIFKRLLDTVYVDNGISHTKIWMVDSTVHVNNAVDTVTVEVIIEKEIIVDRYIVAPPEEKKNYMWWMIIVIVALGLFIIIRVMT